MIISADLQTVVVIIIIFIAFLLGLANRVSESKPILGNLIKVVALLIAFATAIAWFISV